MKLNSSLYALLNNLLDVLPGFGKAVVVRGWLARLALNRCGRNLRISCGVNIFNPQNLAVGDDVYIGPNCYFGGGEIVLEDEVVIGPFVSVAAGNHTMHEGSFRFGPYEFGRIRVGRGTWLCANTVITSNVTIGKGCLVAAGSVVTRDVPDYTVVGGAPARPIKTVAPEDAEALRAGKKDFA